MQKVAKELLGMLSWPAVQARLAAADAAVAALTSGNFAALAAGSSLPTSSAIAAGGVGGVGLGGAGSSVGLSGGLLGTAGLGAAAGQPAGLSLEVLRKMIQVGHLRGHVEGHVEGQHQGASRTVLCGMLTKELA